MTITGTPSRIVIFQTAFLGDVILTLPMIQRLHEQYPQSAIDVVTIPKGSEFLKNHPAIADIIPFDKRNSQKGLKGILALAIVLNRRRYDLAVAPHRSFRTALILALSGIKRRIGFSTASGKFLYTDIVPYDGQRHEIERNLSLLTPLNIQAGGKEKVLPSLYPSHSDREYVDKFLFDREIMQNEKIVAIAPGSIWMTKRWPAERYAELSSLLANDGYEVVVIGGPEDEDLGRKIIEKGRHKKIHDVTGELSLLQSAELIRRAKVLITNDSAPLHIGSAMHTPVAAIFGATVPEFGFGPYGDNAVVIETKGLECRPCAIHGGNRCPISTFVCMNNIETRMVYEKALSVMKEGESSSE